MKRFVSLSAWVVTSALVCGACGGAAKPPTSGDPAASASATSNDSPPATSASATAPVASASASAAASAPPAASSAPLATGDPCADVSAPFEAKVRPEVKKCFFDAMAKRPDLDGHIHITVAINANGKPGNVILANDKILGKDTVTCMTNAVKAGGFEGVACAGKSVVMNMAFGSAARGN